MYKENISHERLVRINDPRWDFQKRNLLTFLSNNSSSGKVIASALPINFKYAGYFALIPETIDLEAHLRNHPLTDYKFVEIDGDIRSVTYNGTLGAYFDIDRLAYVVGLISSIPAENKSLISEEGFVPINSTYIRNFFKDYLSYLDYLIETGVLITDGQFLNGKKSKGFKFSPQYEKVQLVSYCYSYVNQGANIECVPNEIYSRELKGLVTNPILKYPYLSHWYTEGKLTIEKELSERYAYNLLQCKVRRGVNSWDYDISTRRRKNPRSQYNSVMHNIERFVLKDYNAKIDFNVHRLHSTITNFKKDFRNFLKYDGSELVSIDISNSQPYLLCLLFNPEFWRKESELELNIGDLPENIQTLFDEIQIEEICNYVESINQTSIEQYIQRSSEGTVYEYIKDVVNSQTSNNLERDDVKTMILTVFYSKNRYYQQRDAYLKRLFDRLYPEIYGLIKMIKKRSHISFAMLMQSIESEIVLHRCCHRIWDEGSQNVPVFTIHDSIVTTVENQEFVSRIMKDELYRCIGIYPTLKPEYWRIGNIQFPELLQL